MYELNYIIYFNYLDVVKHELQFRVEKKWTEAQYVFLVSGHEQVCPYPRAIDEVTVASKE